MSTLFVGNLSYQTTEDELYQFFGQCGTVNSIRVVADRETNRPKGFAFCEFQDEKSAQKAIDTLNNADLNGRSIRVDWANQKN